MTQFHDDPEAIPGQRVIRKAVIRAYDAITHRADVQIVGSHAANLPDVKVSPALAAADVAVGRRCSLLFVDPSNQDDALVIAVHEGLPTSGGAGATDEIKDADNDTKVQVEEGVDEDKVRMDVAGTERIVLQDATPHLTLTGDLRVFGDVQVNPSQSIQSLTTDRITFASSSPHMTHDGNVRFNDEIAIGSAPTADIMLAVKPSTAAPSGGWKGIDISPSLSDTTSLGNLAATGLVGIVTLNPDGATSGHDLKGLDFQARVSTGGMATGETITVDTITGAELIPAVYNFAFAVTTTVNVTTVTGLWVRPWLNYSEAFGGSGLGTVTTLRGIYIDATSSSADSDHVQDWSGIVIDDPSNPTGNIRLIDTPHFRVTGGGDPGASATNLLINENGTLQAVTVGAADSGGAGYRLLRIPN